MMNFSNALNALKAGNKIRREAWEPKRRLEIDGHGQVCDIKERNNSRSTRWGIAIFVQDIMSDDWVFYEEDDA